MKSFKFPKGIVVSQTQSEIDSGNWETDTIVFNSTTRRLQTRNNDNWVSVSNPILSAFFRGYVDNQSISELSDVNNLDYVANTDTQTIWQYQNNAFVNTNVKLTSDNLEVVQTATNSQIITQNILGEASILIENNIGLSVSPNPVYYKNSSSKAGLGGIIFDEKIYNAGEWFVFENLKLGLGGKGWGISLTKANDENNNVNVDAEDVGTNFDVGGLHSNYQDDLFTNHNTVGKGAVITAQFYPTYLWTYNTTNSKSWVYNSNWSKMNNTIDLGGFYNNPSGGTLRIGIDTDLKFKLQVIDLETGNWTTVMYSNEPADSRNDGYRCVFNPYYAFSQLNVLPNVITLGSSNGGAVPTYKNTHHVNLDGINDYEEVINVNTDVLDFTKTWTISIDLLDVSQVSDNSKITLISRGKNEVTFARQNGNWGIYLYSDGKPIAQSNTWVVPENSRIFISCNGTVIKYYVNGVIKCAPQGMTINSNVSYNDASGNLCLGKPYSQGSYWKGGLNNFANFSIDISSSADAINELFEKEDISQLSYYADAYDFILLGEGEYPNDTGLKNLQTATLYRGNSDDFKLN